MKRPMKHIVRMVVLAALAAVLVAAAPAKKAAKAGAFRPVPVTAVAQDSLIRPGESHFKHLYQVTFGGQNAEAYWSNDGTKLIFQSQRDGHTCDQEYVMDMKTGKVTLVSTGKGRTTCGYFYDHDQRVLWASTHLGGEACPPNPDMSQGYVWPVYESFEIFTSKPDGSDLQQLTHHDGYDAEGTMSLDGQWLIFTSKRENDIDLYKMHMDGTGLQRLTDAPGYDGGAYFSHDGKQIVWRTYRTTDSTALAKFHRLLDQNLVMPTKMDLWVADADGKNQRQVTDKPGASFAPYFTLDDQSIIYASNWESPRSRNFDLYLVPVKGGEPVAVTRDGGFDGFPMFNPNGKWLAFCSNRGAKVQGDTNIYLAEWK